MSHLCANERVAISAMQGEIHQLHRELFHRQNSWVLDDSPGFELFQNKHFNKMRLRYVNLNAKEIKAQLRRVWVEQLTQEERGQFTVLAQ